MAKKIKIKNEDPSINFRLPEALKIQIYKKAAIENKTVSNFLRDHLTEYLDGSLYEYEIEEYKSDSFINSTEFLQLVVWVYTKREKNDYEETDVNRQDDYIATIKSIGDQLPSELVDEFDKVLMDLMKLKKKASSYSSYEFCRSGYPYDERFNYSLLEKHLLKDRFVKEKVYVNKR